MIENRNIETAKTKRHFTDETKTDFVFNFNTKKNMKHNKNRIVFKRNGNRMDVKWILYISIIRRIDYIQKKKNVLFKFVEIELVCNSTKAKLYLFVHLGKLPLYFKHSFFFLFSFDLNEQLQ